MDKKASEIKQLADTFLESVAELEKNRNKETQYKMCEALYRLELYVPTKDGNAIAKETFRTLENEQGKRFIPAFLGKDSVLGEFKQTELQLINYLCLKYYVIDAPEMFAGIVINPFEHNFVFDDSFIEIADSVIMGMSIKSNKNEGKVIITKPQTWNLKMINDLYKIFDGALDVNRAWMFNSKEESGEAPHITIMVDFDGEKVDLFPSLAEVMGKYLDVGDSFELIKKEKDYDASQLEEVKIFSRG